MKAIFLLLLVSLFSLPSCNERKNTAVPLPEKNGIINDMMIYEGRVPLDEKRALYIELSLVPSTIPGEGRFNLEEIVEDENESTALSSLTGMYAITYGYGEEEQDFMVQLHNSGLSNGIKRVYTTGEKMFEETFRKNDLTLLSKGENKLLVLNNNSKPITLAPEFNLVKRVSKLFTVEGYFIYKNDTTDFFEMNTKEKLAVSNLGEYFKACQQYHQLTEKKSEPIYLKAVGFNVKQMDREGKEIQALVLKRIIQTSSLDNNE
jgi:hypothetical protein